MHPAQDSFRRWRKLVVKSPHPDLANLVPRGRDKQETRTRWTLACPSRESEKQRNTRPSLTCTSKPSALWRRYNNQILAAIESRDHVLRSCVAIILAVHKQRRLCARPNRSFERRRISRTGKHDRNRPRLGACSDVQSDDLLC